MAIEELDNQDHYFDFDEDDNILTHKKYSNKRFEQLTETGDKYKDDISWLNVKSNKLDYNIGTYRYFPNDNEIIICPEPLEFISQFDDISNNVEECNDKFKKMIQDFEVLKVDQNIISTEGYHKKIWYNSSSKFINLRPGFEDAEDTKPIPIKMGDIAVHGVIVGRTGSGKSVFINNLIFNLLEEYPPWELDLYLADFKKVELSRYRNRIKNGVEYRVPHIKAIAATSEIRYVLTLIEYLVDCMKARQTLFGRLGLTKLSEFREKYNVVLPRVLFVVDEFQQLFLEATTREANRINDLLLSIVKLGRATGFHLLFASQEMSGALSGKALANFKIRFALPCEADVSAAILGNSAAENIDTGFVLANVKNGDVKYNQEFQVPFIDSEDEPEDGSDSYFYQTLKDMHILNEEYHLNQNGIAFNKESKSYNEDYRDEIERLEEILEDDRLVEIRKKICNDKKYVASFVLGDGVVYSTKRYDLETFYMEKGQNKNIAILSPRPNDVVYLLKLLAINIKKSPCIYQNTVFSFDNLIKDAFEFDITTILDKSNVNEFFDISDLIEIEDDYKYRKIFNDAEDLQNFVKLYYDDVFITLKKENNSDKEKLKKIESDYKDIINFWLNEEDGYLVNCNIDDVENHFENWIDDDEVLDYDGENIVHIIKQYIKFQKLNNREFTPKFYWIIGMDMIEKFPKWLQQIMKKGYELGMYFITTNTTLDNFSDALSTAEYIFVGGNLEKFYDKAGINYTKKEDDSIVIDFKIKSLNTTRSFKKYRDNSINTKETPSINFDDILK